MLFFKPCGNKSFGINRVTLNTFGQFRRETTSSALKEIVHLRKNVVIDFDIVVFLCVIVNKRLPSLFRFILFKSLVLSKR